MILSIALFFLYGGRSNIGNTPMGSKRMAAPGVSKQEGRIPKNGSFSEEKNVSKL
jgi:hypothetical protein